jgi:hypothetical protein
MELDKNLALMALKMLDEAMTENGLPYTRLTIGGGASMLLAHGFPGKTNDVDAIPSRGAHFDEIKTLAEGVAKRLNIEHDWLNPHFSAYTIYLPADAKNRMHVIYTGKGLTVEALGVEDLLVMKLMANRAKDRKHITHLFRNGNPDISIVENALQSLKDKNLYKVQAEKALDLLDEELNK